MFLEKHISSKVVKHIFANRRRNGTGSTFLFLNPFFFFFLKKKKIKNFNLFFWKKKFYSKFLNIFFKIAGETELAKIFYFLILFFFFFEIKISRELRWSISYYLACEP